MILFPFPPHSRAKWLAILTPVLLTLLIRQSKGSSTETTANRLPMSYPESFSITFYTNITAADNIGDNDYPVMGKQHYDWTRRRQRIDHAPGSYECQHFYHTHHSCSLLFLEQGMYRITHSNSANGRPCCLDLASVRTPPPDWAARANPTFDGVFHDVYSGRLAYQWTFDHLDPPFQHTDRRDVDSVASSYHSVRQAASWDAKDGDEKFAPLVFTFPGKAVGKQDFHYQIETLELGPPDPSMFQLPEGCESIICDKARQSIS